MLACRVDDERFRTGTLGLNAGTLGFVCPDPNEVFRVYFMGSGAEEDGDRAMQRLYNYMVGHIIKWGSHLRGLPFNVERPPIRLLASSQPPYNPVGGSHPPFAQRSPLGDSHPTSAGGCSQLPSDSQRAPSSHFRVPAPMGLPAALSTDNSKVGLPFTWAPIRNS